MKRKPRNGQLHLNRFWCLCFMMVGLSWAQVGSSKTIAFLGDSISTGAVTSPHLSFDKSELWRLFRGEIDNSPDLELFNSITGLEYEALPPPKRLWPSMREYMGPTAFSGVNLINAFSTVYLDTEQYSWAYMLGRQLGYEPSEILIAAQDGARMEAGIRQIDRVLDYTQGEIPEKIFIFFTGNDLCGPSIELTKSADEYAGELSSLLRYLLRNGTTSKGGSEIYVLGFMGIMQLTTSPEILGKKVTAHGQETTCSELQKIVLGTLSKSENEFIKENPEASWFMAMFPNSPVAMCPTVFDANPDRTPEQKSMLANRIRAIRKQSSIVVDHYKEIAKSRKGEDPIKFYFLDATGELLFRAEDIAADCFHLSLVGQRRIAQSLLEVVSGSK